MRKIALIALSLMLVCSAAACDNKPTATTVPVQTTAAAATTDAAEGEREFTPDELAEFDGKDGRNAYVAVDGVVYDLTDSAAWKNGQHNGFEAGKDLTDEIKNDSPHGVGNLEGIPVVGKLVG